MKSKFLILFAGAPGSSKSPIANYLSWKLNLPLFNTDIINTEMREDRLFQDQEEFEKRRKLRTNEALELGYNFIADFSIDRKFSNYKPNIEEKGYKYFIVSIDLSKEFLEKIYKAKEYQAIDKIPSWIEDHNQFLKEYNNLVNLHITEETFPDRLEITYNAVKAWINS